MNNKFILPSINRKHLYISYITEGTAVKSAQPNTQHTAAVLHSPTLRTACKVLADQAVQLAVADFYCSFEGVGKMCDFFGNVTVEVLLVHGKILRLSRLNTHFVHSVRVFIDLVTKHSVICVHIVNHIVTYFITSSQMYYVADCKQYLVTSFLKTPVLFQKGTAEL